MKRIGLTLIFFFLVVGCATTPKKPYIIPQYIKDSPAAAIFKKAGAAMGITKNITLYIYNDKTPNAYVDAKDNVHLSEGIFQQYDNDALTFVIAHELAHVKLNHVQKVQAVSVATTVGMLVLNVFVPGAGILNHAVNPAITNNFSKPQELAADKLASQVLREHFGISVERQSQILRNFQLKIPQNGGFWADHPSWDDRITNIQRQ